MQLIIIALILLLFAHDALVASMGELPQMAGLDILVFTSLSIKMAVALTFYFIMQTIRHRVEQGDRKPWRWLGRVLSGYQFTVLFLFALDLVMGGLVEVRGVIGDLVLVDELILLLPTLAMLVWQWWVYYPIDRRLREGMLIKQASLGRPVSPLLSRGQYLRSQMRMQLGMVVLPLLVLMGWVELVEVLGPTGWQVLGHAWLLPVTVAGALAMFLALPLVIRWVWQTEPLPGGEVRRFLLEICRRNSVRVRELLLWRTHGAVINAAVMGLHPRVRFILLTDGLLDQMDQSHIEAIMAHELAHVKHRHLIWLLVAAIAIGGLLQFGLTMLFFGVMQLLGNLGIPANSEWIGGFTGEQFSFTAVVLLTCFGWLWLFGIISRLAERQADTFAVEHCVRMQREPTQDERGRALIDADAVRSMTSALERVAELNHMSTSRHDWRHGSIVDRQRYLRSLVDKPVDDLPINTTMHRVNLAALVVTALMIGLVTVQNYAPTWLAGVGL